MARTQQSKYRLALLTAILLLAAGLRFGLLGAGVRFHPDEAFFAAFARNAAVRGEWLLPGNLDKPPLAIYGQAVGMVLVGIRWDGAVWRLDALQGEFAARLWSAYASVVLVALTARLAAALGVMWRGVMIAALLMALSPYGVAFGAVAFTDTPMLTAAVAALVAAAYGRGGWAGVALVVAVGSKQQGLLFAPLVLALLWRRSGVGCWWRFGVTVTGGMAILLVWDAARPFTSVWVQGTANNAPSDAIWLGEVWPRLRAWWPYTRLMYGPLTPALWLLMGIGWWGVRGGRLLLAFCVGYAALHLLVPLNIYDRYVLPLVPVGAILIGGALGRWRWAGAVVGGALVLMVPGAWVAMNAHPHIGGDRGQHTGIIALTDYVNHREFGAIVYDRWLGWELDYYLGAWSDKRRAYYPSSFAMITDPAVYLAGPAPRYMPAPKTAAVWPWVVAWWSAGFEVDIGYTDDRFVVFVLTRPGVASGGASSVTDSGRARHPAYLPGGELPGYDAAARSSRKFAANQYHIRSKPASVGISCGAHPGLARVRLRVWPVPCASHPADSGGRLGAA